MKQNESMTDEHRVAEAIRQLCIQAAKQGYAEAAASGLCDEGAFEAAIGAMQMLDLRSAGTHERREAMDALERQSIPFSGIGETTMTISMYHVLVPVMTNTLANLAGILEKGAAYAEAKKIDPSVLVTARLYPDMLPLSRQVQIAGDTAKGSVARLAGQEPPKFEDNEASFPELIARVQKTMAFLQTFTPAQIDGSEQRTVQLTLRGQTITYQGLPYVLHHALPNFFFHVTTAYNILRHNGVELGKRDYIGKVQ